VARKETNDMELNEHELSMLSAQRALRIVDAEVTQLTEQACEAFDKAKELSDKLVLAQRQRDWLRLAMTRLSNMPHDKPLPTQQEFNRDVNTDEREVLQERRKAIEARNHEWVFGVSRRTQFVPCDFDLAALPGVITRPASGSKTHPGPVTWGSSAVAVALDGMRSIDPDTLRKNPWLGDPAGRAMQPPQQCPAAAKE